jgi:SAM-dependent methyltransferase
MNKKHLEILVCPDCDGEFILETPVFNKRGGIESGKLKCVGCSHEFPIIRHIPRFVGPQNYADNFGFQWNFYSKTQFDETIGRPISKDRFFSSTGWTDSEQNEAILEIGGGSGRFTRHAATIAGLVVSVDISSAVEANYSSNGNLDNVLIVQADLFHLPLRKSSFEKVFCLGVIQHTPNPRKALAEMAKYLEENGSLVCDVYRHKWLSFITPRKWLRVFTKRMKPESLFKLVNSWVDFCWPLVRIMRRLPGGRMFNRTALVVADYAGAPGYEGLSEKQLIELAKLDTFDGLGAYYEYRQTKGSFRDWFVKAGLVNIDIFVGGNGFVGRALKPRKADSNNSCAE